MKQSTRRRRRSGKTAFLFPQTTAQHCGMGRELKKSFPGLAAELGSLDKLLGRPLSLKMEGPEELLHPRADSADFPVHMEVLVEFSLAAALALSRAGARPDAVAGSSVGELAAAAFAGTVGAADCFAMTRELALGCQACCLSGPSACCMVYGLSKAELGAVTAGLRKRGHFCQAVYVFDRMRTGMVGFRPAALPALKKALSGYRHELKELNSQGAFHTSIFSPLARRMRTFTAPLAFRPASVPIYMNRDAGPQTRPENIRKNICSAMDHPVLWQEILDRMLADGVRTFVELSPKTMITEFICDLPPGAVVLRTDSAENYSRALAFLTGA